MEFTTDINNVMYAYIDRKKKLPVTTLLRAIGYETDKDILEIFNLAQEIKVSKTGLKKVIGRRLAARVVRAWIEDFVDEDTGEVVSIESTEVIIERETILENHMLTRLLMPALKQFSFTEMKPSLLTIQSSSIHFKKILRIQKKKPLNLYTGNYEMPNHLMKKLHVELLINCSFPINVMILVMLEGTGSIKN